MSLDISVNHLAFGPVLRARLGMVSGLAEVGGTVELDAAMRAGVSAPAAFVIYGGMSTRTTPGGKMRRPRAVTQIWEVNVLAPLSWLEADQMSAAGALLADLSDALEGWQPDGANKELEPVAVDEPVVYAGGLVHFVLAFQIDLILR